MAKNTQTKSTAVNGKEKEAEKLEKKTQKMIKKINSVVGSNSTANASTGAQTASQTSSNSDEIQMLTDWVKTLYSLHQKLIGMYKSHKLDTDEYKELALTINTDIKLCGMFVRSIDQKRKLLHTTW